MNGRNALIDGWRGLSVALVIVGHFVYFRLGQGVPIAPPSGGGALPFADAVLSWTAPYAKAFMALGVDVFFLISGYLITSLLMAEEAREGAVNIVAFYVRRSFRIMPGFYAMLLTAALLQRGGHIHLPTGAIARSGLYLCDLGMVSCGWWLAHTWSLAVEEQFYLFWPAMFLLPVEIRRVVIAALAVALPVYSAAISPVFDGFGYIAVGAALASFAAVQNALGRLAATPLPNLALAAILVGALPVVAREPALRLAQQTTQPALLALVVFAALSGHGWMARVVASPLPQRLGVVSYSLYLWQQFSLAPRAWAGLATGADGWLTASPLSAALFVVPALLSYVFLEKPLTALGRNLSRALTQARKSGRAAEAA